MKEEIDKNPAADVRAYLEKIESVETIIQRIMKK